MPFLGLARTNTRPSSKPTSWIWFRSSSEKSTGMSISLIFLAASITALPFIRVTRLPQVPRSALGVVAVSMAMSRMFSMGMPSSAAKIWRMAVSGPWPMSQAMVASWAVPSSYTETSAALKVVLGVEPVEHAAADEAEAADAQALARLGILFFRFSSHPLIWRTFSRDSLKPQELMVATSGITSPVCMALIRRMSMGSMPNSSAARFIWVSATKAAWGAPKPRMALAGGLLVYTWRPK